MANVYFELTREFNRDGPVAVLASGQARVDEMALPEAHQAARSLAEEWLPVVPAGLEQDDADAQ